MLFIGNFVLAIKKMRVRVKAAAQHSSSELSSAFTLHFTCISGSRSPGVVGRVSLIP